MRGKTAFPQVIAFHHNLLHSGMLNNSAETRRYYLSVFYTRLGLASRNLPSIVDEAEVRNAPFPESFLYINAHFTKTGSGQT